MLIVFVGFARWVRKRENIRITYLCVDFIRNLVPNTAGIFVFVCASVVPVTWRQNEQASRARSPRRVSRSGWRMWWGGDRGYCDRCGSVHGITRWRQTRSLRYVRLRNKHKHIEYNRVINTSWSVWRLVLKLCEQFSDIILLLLPTEQVQYPEAW